MAYLRRLIQIPGPTLSSNIANKLLIKNPFSATIINIKERFMDTTHILKEITYKDSGRDPVTGLLLKGEFREVIRQVLQKEPDAFDLIYFDISQFKVYNHRNGINAGDELLRNVGQVIMTSTGNPFVYRENGDHFFALCERERSEDIAHVVHEEFVQNRKYNVSLRSGIYSLTRTDVNSDASILLDKARIAGQL